LENEITERLPDHYLISHCPGTGGFTLELIQQEEPATGQSSEEPQEQKANG
jgi:hypothetical protein